MSWFDRNYIIEKETLTAIADAIREKTGEPALFKIDPVAMPQKIRGIKSGSTGGGGMDAYIEGTTTKVSSGATKVRANAFKSDTTITSANFPNARRVEESAFQSCTSMTSANFPSVMGMGKSAFQSCSKMTSANFPKLSKVWAHSFRDCYQLTDVDFSNAEGVGYYACNGCRALTTVDLPKVKQIEGCAFYNCYSLKSVILRAETVCTLDSVDAFGNCYHIHGTVNSTYNPNGDKDGFIFVPANLVEQYRNSTNWSEFASQIRAIDEGGGEAEGNWLFQNEQINGMTITGLPAPTIGVSYTCFVDGEEIGTAICEAYGGDGYSPTLSFNTEDYRVWFLYATYVGDADWYFHPMDSQVQSGGVSIRINE